MYVDLNPTDESVLFPSSPRRGGGDEEEEHVPTHGRMDANVHTNTRR